MSLGNRLNSVLLERAEQLKRWENSETNKVQVISPVNANRRVSFSGDLVFLSACVEKDKDEVIELIKRGANVDTKNLDGLTALHQACINEDLDMVKFLVELGANKDQADNDGWTPLHSVALSGALSIARYLIEAGCSLAMVNNDNQLALDMAVNDTMKNLLQEVVDAAGIDCEWLRSNEERLLLRDAMAWRNGVPGKDNKCLKFGATALHVAAAKGYINVLEILLEIGCDVNAVDNDGWTPLHAAAYWGQSEACRHLVEHFCDMEIKNYEDETAFDVADPEILTFLEELKKTQDEKSPEMCVVETDQNANEISQEEVVKDDVRKVEFKIESCEDESCQTEDVQENMELAPIENRSPQPMKIDTNESRIVKWEAPPSRLTKILKRVFEKDRDFYQRYMELKTRIKQTAGSILNDSNDNNTGFLNQINKILMTNKISNSSSKKERNWRRLAREVAPEDVEKAKELLERRRRQNIERSASLKFEDELTGQDRENFTKNAKGFQSTQKFKRQPFGVLKIIDNSVIPNNI